MRRRRSVYARLKHAIIAGLPPWTGSALRSARAALEQAAWRGPTLANLSEVSGYVDTVDVVSCDLFDTLVMRDVEPPDYLVGRTAAFAELLLGRSGRVIRREDFSRARGQVEYDLRQAAWERGDDPECTLTEILHGTLSRLLDPDVARQLTPTLVVFEVRTEYEHLRPAPGAAALLEGLARLGKRLVVTSDTYLERAHVLGLIERFRFDRYVKELYVSAEHRRGKYSGRLFYVLVQREQVEPDRVLHFGDNFESDVRGARRGGVRGLLLSDRERLLRRQALRRVTKRAVATGVLPLFEATDRDGESDRLGKLFVLGRDGLAPALGAWVLRQIEQGHRDGACENVYQDAVLPAVHRILENSIDRLRALPPIAALAIVEPTGVAGSVRSTQSDVALAMVRGVLTRLAGHDEREQVLAGIADGVAAFANAVNCHDLPIAALERVAGRQLNRLLRY